MIIHSCEYELSYPRKKLVSCPTLDKSTCQKPPRTISLIDTVGVKKYHVDPALSINKSNQDVNFGTKCDNDFNVHCCSYLSSGLPTACTGHPPTHLAIAPAELHHGSSEFLELDIFPAYSMQFDYIP